MYIRVSITVYDAIQCWNFQRIRIWSQWQVYAHFTYIADTNNSDTILNVIFIAKESYTSIFKSFCDKTWTRHIIMFFSWPGAGFYMGQNNMAGLK